MSQSNCELIRIPIKQINYENSINFDFVKSLGLSDLYLNNNEGLNSIPITVILDKNRNYQLIDGYEIFHALVRSGKEWIIAVCISEELVKNDNWKYELGLRNSKLNICTLGAEDFQTFFEYVQKKFQKLSNINIDKLVTAFANDKKRIYWSNLDSLVEARAGITKTKIQLLDQYLYASPDLSTLKPIRAIDINISTEADIFNQIERLKIEPQAIKLRKIDTLSTARTIVANKDRIYWSCGKHLIQAKVGITPSIWSLIESAFSFNPSPTPIPNTSKFLLNHLTVKQLREEAKARDIEIKGLSRSEIVENLSNKL